MDECLIKPYWALRIGLGASAFLAGLDKFFNLLAQWDMYVSPLATRLVPFDTTMMLRFFGVVEIVVGLSILFGRTRVAALIASAWLLTIAANLLTTGNFYDIAVRDVNMAIAAFALSRLDVLYETVRESRSVASTPQSA